MNTADTIEVTAERILSDGFCVSKERVRGKPLRFPYALPGETLRVRALRDGTSFIEAETEEVLSPAPARVTPACPYYMMCGGCTLSHAAPDAQRKLKLNFLKNAFEAQRIEIPEIRLVAGCDTGYRARVTLEDGGFCRLRSHEVIGIKKCLCATDEINSYLSSMPFDTRPKGKIRLFGSRYLKGERRIALAALPSGHSGRYSKGMRSVPTRDRYEGTSPLSESLCRIEILKKTIAFDVLGFFQSNIQLLSETIPLVLEDLGGRLVLDIYAGCGVFSSFLADTFEKVVTVEHNKGAVACCAQNMNGRPHESYALSGAAWVKYQSASCRCRLGAFDALFIDPPRSGMEKEVREWIARERISTVRSLSCDAVTHARDIGFLVRAGYKIRSLSLLDFYPHTMRIESFVELEL